MLETNTTETETETRQRRENDELGTRRNVELGTVNDVDDDERRTMNLMVLGRTKS